jgi:hypothetical protein
VKIENHTAWQTAHVRAFVTRLAKQYLDPHQIKSLHVVVQPRDFKGAGCLGRAYRGDSSRWMARTMWLFMDNITHRDFPKRRLAKVIDHELGHLRGLTHRDMRAAGHIFHGWEKDWQTYYQWADEMPLERVTVPAPKPAPGPLEVLSAKAVHAAGKVREWQTRIKRAQTGMRKWQRRMKDAERRMAKLRAEQSAAVPSPPLCP